MSMRKDRLLLITGGAGFIGSCMVRYLNDLGWRALVLVDNLGYTEKWRNLVGKQFVDLLHKDQLFRWLEGREGQIGGIIHFGACSSTLASDANYLLENNYRYTQRLAEYALKHQIRFLYASSASTYGDGSKGFSDDHSLLEELRPLNMYGYSKHLFDLWAHRQGVLSQLVGVKFFNVFGPNEHHKGEMTSAIYKMVPQILNEGLVRLFKFVASPHEPDRYADGEQCRDFLYVKDAVRMVWELFESDASGIFNMGLGLPHTWNFLARCVFSALERPEQIEYIDMPQELLGKYQNFTCAEMDKFEKRFPAHQALALENAILDYVRNHLLVGKTW